MNTAKIEAKTNNLICKKPIKFPKKVTFWIKKINGSLKNKAIIIQGLKLLTVDLKESLGSGQSNKKNKNRPRFGSKIENVEREREVAGG